ACHSIAIRTLHVGWRTSSNCRAGRRRRVPLTGHCSGNDSEAEMKCEPTVSATFNYTRDTGIVPEVYFYEPPAGTAARMPGDDPREMTVHSGWDRASSFALDREGFALREFCSQFREWGDDAAIGTRFYDEAAEFVKHQVGARRVIIFDHTIRARR